MDRKIKLLAATVAAAITTSACTPQGVPNANTGINYSGSTTAPVTHSHSGKVHAHLLPATGIRHTHNTGTGGGTAAPTSNNGGMTHSHSGKVHTHKLPATGISHTHRIGSGGSGGGSTPTTNNGLSHSHSGKVHAHKFPATGINHTHRVGGGPATSGNTNVASNTRRDPNAHSHSGKVHSHKLPNTGLNHTHRVGGNGSVPTAQPTATGQTNVASNTRRDPNAHSHSGRVHSHRLPKAGLNHGHGTGAVNRAPTANNYRPPAANPYRPPAVRRPPVTRPGNNNGGIAHNHNGRNHSHRLPASGMNHAHGGAANNANTQTNTNRGANYYDYTNNTGTNTAPTNNTNGNSYYDYSASGSNSQYYNNTRPKGSSAPATNYDYSAPATTNSRPSTTASGGGFAPNNYSGGNIYTVQRGDTVFQVMRNTGVYWKDIIRINNLKAPNYQIVPGQRLRLR